MVATEEEDCFEVVFSEDALRHDERLLLPNKRTSTRRSAVCGDRTRLAVLTSYPAATPLTRGRTACRLERSCLNTDSVDVPWPEVPTGKGSLCNRHLISCAADSSLNIERCRPGHCAEPSGRPCALFAVLELHGAV